MARTSAAIKMNNKKLKSEFSFFLGRELGLLLVCGMDGTG